MIHYLLLFSFCGFLAFAQGILNTKHATGTLEIKSWKELRDLNVVKQNLDYSCGPASTATILTHYYNRPTTEKEIIQSMGQWKAASFADISRILPDYGYKGLGLALNFQQLRKIKIPAIVYLKHKGQDHFSVLRGVNDTTVFLADPSWGNVRFTWSHFLEMWETREDEKEKGKILLIVPISTKMAQIQANKEFFSKENINFFDTEVLLFRPTYTPVR
jgi:hypothetical protein